MFERFTVSARQTVVQAQVEARELGHSFLGTEHLLLGLLHQSEDPSVEILVGMGLDLPTARGAVVKLLGNGAEGVDAAALGAIGIDLTAVRESVEAAFGPGALDVPGDDRGKPRRGVRTSGSGGSGGRVSFTGRAKKTMELSLREALALKSRTIEPGHILLGLIREGEGIAAQVLRGHGLDLQALRAAVEIELKRV